MFKNYLKIAFRNLVKRKGFSCINISGLAIGIACFLLICSYVHNEMNYDTFHKNVEQIYKVYTIDKAPGGGEVYSAMSPDPLSRTLKNDYPEIVNITRLFYLESWVAYGEKSFKEKVFATDPAFFDMFSFSLLRGNPQTALTNLNSVVITEEFAEKYFGREDPMGKILNIRKHDFIVTGVMRKTPENSSIRFKLLIPAQIRNSLDPDFEKRWWSSGTHTFVQLSDAFSAVELEKQFPHVIEKYVPDFLKNRMRLALQPLTSMHLDSRMVGKLVPGNSRVYLYILLLIALFVLCIASINFMNLSTARFTERAKEIGMRKVLGAHRGKLILQFLGDSILMSFVSLILGIALTEIFLPEFNALTGKALSLGWSSFQNLAVLFGFGLLVGILSGLYPALFLSSYRPLLVLKQQQKISRRNINFRRTLVVAQFGISIALIIGLFIITQQLRYMKTTDLGFNPNNMIVVSTQTRNLQDPLKKITTYRDAIHAQMASVGIISDALSENIPGYYFQNKFGVIPENRNDRVPLEMVVTSIDEKFLDAYEMRLLEGRNFSPEFGTDAYGAVLLNETAVRKLGWQSAVGKEIRFVHGEGPFTVVGVVKDIHFESLQNAIEPLVYRYAADRYKIGFLSFRTTPAKTAAALRFLQQKWQVILQDVPFEFFFLRNQFNQNYQAEETTAKIIRLFSLFAVFIACLGLFGLTALAVTQRTKEIGIRKVLGATAANVVGLLSKVFVKLVLLANFLAWPVAWWAMNKWLQNFAYRTNIAPWIFVLSGACALVIALLTISFQAVKAALANPVDALRYE